MSDKCDLCKNDLPQDDFVKCTVNNCKLHYECAGIAKKTYFQMGNTRRENYKCIICREDDKSLNAQPSTDYPADFFIKMEAKIDETVKKSFEKYSKMLNSQVDELRKLAEFISTQYDEMKADQDRLNGKIKTLRENEICLQRQCDKLSAEIEILQTQHEQAEQYSRRHNIIIEGVPEIPNENIYDTVNKFAVAVDETIVLNQDIQAAHRLPSKHPNRPRPVVVQFSNRQKRDAVLKKSRNRRIQTTAFTPNVPPSVVFVNEHLTPFYKKLLFEAKKLKTERGFKYIWIANSKILVKKDDGDAAVVIRSPSCIAKLLNQSTS